MRLKLVKRRVPESFELLANQFKETVAALPLLLGSSSEGHRELWSQCAALCQETDRILGQSDARESKVEKERSESLATAKKLQKVLDAGMFRFHQSEEDKIKSKATQAEQIKYVTRCV